MRSKSGGAICTDTTIRLYHCSVKSPARRSTRVLRGARTFTGGDIYMILDDAQPRDHHPQLRDRQGHQRGRVSYAAFVKKLHLPSGFTPPTRLTYQDVVAAALTRANLAGSITRAHHNVDLAVWLNDYARIAALLQAEGWEHTPGAGEDGHTAYERGSVRLELAFLARDSGGDVPPSRQTGCGRIEWGHAARSAHHGQPAWGAGARAVRTWPVCERNSSPMRSTPHHSATIMNRVRPSSPPSMQAKQALSSSIRCSTSPSSPTRQQAGRLSCTTEHQMAPSASRQMPSPLPGPPRSAQTRRFDRPPSAAMSKAVSLPVNDSATTRVWLSGVTTMPLGKARPSATCLTEPSGVTRAIMPGRNSSSPKRKLMLFT